MLICIYYCFAASTFIKLAERINSNNMDRVTQKNHAWVLHRPSLYHDSIMLLNTFYLFYGILMHQSRKYCASLKMRNISMSDA